MSELRVFYDLFSQPCRAVVLFLEANKIPYESVLISLTEGTSTVLCAVSLAQGHTMCGRTDMLSCCTIMQKTGSFIS